MANPPQQNLQQQAAGYAAASVPTVGSINQQYGRSIGDAQQFALALVHLLQNGGADPYGGAVASQTAANQAAMSRLSALGSPYAAGSAAAVGGMGDSALAALNAKRGAAQMYMKALPGIAAAKGSQSALALRTARGQAITQRNQQYSQAFQSALQQLRSQAIQQQQFNANLGLQRAQMAQQASQFAQDLAFRQQQLQVSQAQFNARYGPNAPTSQSQTAGYTPSELSSMTERAGKALGAIAIQGVPIQKAINQLVAQHGILPIIATRAAYSAYTSMTQPQKSEFANPSTGQFDSAGWRKAWAAWTRAQSSLQKFISSLQAPTTNRYGGAKTGPPRGGKPGNPHA